ncbi:putative ribose-5-phosphate isomerase chloroplastic isoform B [Micractinium conductrix]|uniref:ribose-5-phosphate isomerase n=1 Tax=Micractinium conductrix TaxID=554055 RepID=A0A2P6V536_9CHLO|nr:putative ribose-5-phosphate isomerase chloroplastic isoform B [Micractinium conductrix]|eukprot:PSC69203.1 putative ribose-5-phosphate isomerase chloroplastic isoform B [Micractinium conductrix]
MAGTRALCFRSAAVSARQVAQLQQCRRQPRPSVAAAAAASGGAPADPAEERMRAAAAFAADTFVRDEITIGLGTGQPVNALIEEVASRLSAGKLRAVRAVPASDVAAAEAALHGVPLTTLEEAGGRLDFFFEAADELSNDAEGSLAFMIGCAQQPTQPQLHRARALAAAATTNVVLADATAVVPRLGGSLPVAVEEEAWEDSGELLDDIFLGDAELWRRSTEEGVGPRGGDAPYVSPEGHALIDIRFYEGLKLLGEDADYGSIAREIESVEGVVAHGLMANVAAAAVVATAAGPRLVWRGEQLAAGAGRGGSLGEA